MKSASLSVQKLHLHVILLLYLVISSILCFAYRYEITPDTFAFIRLAENVAQGHFDRAVNGAWPPLITWLMAPFLLLGFSGLATFRIVTVLGGLILILGCRQLTLRFSLSENSRLITTIISTLLIAHWTIRNPGPNLLFTAFIMFYLYFYNNLLENI